MFKRDNYLQKYWTRVNYLNLSQIFLCSVCWNLLCIKKSISFFVWCLSLKGVKHSDTRLLPQYFQIRHHSLHKKMKFSFSKCDQIRSFLRVWSHLRNKSLMENFIFCAVKNPVNGKSTKVQNGTKVNTIQYNSISCGFITNNTANSFWDHRKGFIRIFNTKGFYAYLVPLHKSCKFI